MRKYYVTWGEIKFVVSAATDLQACLLTLAQIPEDCESIGSTFRVSQRGHDPHDDDSIYSAANIIELRMLANEAFVPDSDAVDHIFEDYQL